MNFSSNPQQCMFVCTSYEGRLAKKKKKLNVHFIYLFDWQALVK